MTQRFCIGMANQVVKVFTVKDQDISCSIGIPKVHQLLDTFFNKRALHCEKAVVQAVVLNGERDGSVQDLLQLDVSPLLFKLGTTGQLPEGKKVRPKDDNLLKKLDFGGIVAASKCVYKTTMCCYIDATVSVLAIGVLHYGLKESEPYTCISLKEC
ncbi:hypothetical protein POM88_008249 [Heracleum sosnowskyi]|uniref:Uncharacterized protein n=1 Tax=Heracleum sosnowskyi TaxID=360622 RepID=A0AAD8N774_9APIA|nr:hypothetical protein POM88_008249 [Heracleum sosnowskyi]